MREDSRALLKLLLESGQSYDDIAGVLGDDHETVRERARDALAELGGDRPSPELTDYLLGEASPVERADLARRLSADETEASRAAKLAAKLREIAPNATLPVLPAVAPDAAPAALPAEEREELEDGATSGSQTRVVLAIAALAIVVVGVTLAVTGGFGGDDDTADTGAEQLSLEDVDALSVELEPADDGDASGEATLGLATADQPFVDLTLKGLAPIEASDTYIVWLMASEQRGWPLGLVEPDDEGNQAERYPVPQFLLQTSVIKGLSEIVISRSPRQAAFDAADEAAKSGVPEVDFVGDAVARGEVPNAGALAPQG